MNEKEKKELIGALSGRLSYIPKHSHITHAVDSGDIEVLLIHCPIRDSEHHHDKYIDRKDSLWII